METTAQFEQRLQEETGLGSLFPESLAEAYRVMNRKKAYRRAVEEGDIEAGAVDVSPHAGAGCRGQTSASSCQAVLLKAWLAARGCSASCRALSSMISSASRTQAARNSSCLGPVSIDRFGAPWPCRAIQAASASPRAGGRTFLRSGLSKAIKLRQTPRTRIPATDGPGQRRSRRCRGWRSLFRR